MSDRRPTILLTGGSSGIGLQAVLAMKRLRPDIKIIPTGRSTRPSALPAEVEYLTLDLCSQSSIRQLVSDWSYGLITHLVLNAGQGAVGAPTYTADNIETSFASNHTGHALLVLLLIRRQLFDDKASFVFCTTALHDPEHVNHPVVHWTTPAEVAACTDPVLHDSRVRYGTTKLGGVLFAWALHRHVVAAAAGAGAGGRWRVNVFEPGFAPGRGSKLARGLPTPAQYLFELLVPAIRAYAGWKGVKTSTPQLSGEALATFTLGQQYEDWNGRYLLFDEEKKTSKLSYDQDKQDELWDWTIKTMAKDDDELREFEAI